MSEPVIQKTDKIVITGAAGLVGQNLVLLLREQGYTNLVAMDKHAANLETLKSLNPGVTTRCADLGEVGDWKSDFEKAACVVVLQAQITGLRDEDFIRNNVTANNLIIEVCKQFSVPYVVQISSSVLHSAADDIYIKTKTAQEKTVTESGLKYVVLRPTLMFGWFDPKHLGWLSRFMEKVPVFPVPGNGKFLRQPLYNRDFCRMIQFCIESQPEGKAYDVVGHEDISYIDMIRLIRKVKGLKTWIVCIPYWLFALLLRLYALVDRNPPFTVSQLKALTVGDYFEGVDTDKEFGVTQTPLDQAFTETFADPCYAQVVIER
jgi:nucleoside-diphosphate-sugar epimerase